MNELFSSFINSFFLSFTFLHLYCWGVEEPSHHILTSWSKGRSTREAITEINRIILGKFPKKGGEVNITHRFS